MSLHPSVFYCLVLVCCSSSVPMTFIVLYCHYRYFNVGYDKYGRSGRHDANTFNLTSEILSEHRCISCKNPINNENMISIVESCNGSHKYTADKCFTRHMEI